MYTVQVAFSNFCFTTASVDYDPLSGTTVTFGPGVTRQCVVIQINQDSGVEGDERFGVSATSTNINRLTVSPDTTTVCITETDSKSFQYLQKYTVRISYSTMALCSNDIFLSLCY